jgi:putative endonuclease
MFYCYVLYSVKLDNYYIGSTKDLEGRLLRHNSSKRGFTSTTGKPWVIKYSEIFETKKLALQREFKLKSWKSRKAIEKLIKKV